MDDDELDQEPRDDGGWTDDLDHDVWTDEELGFAADVPVVVRGPWRPPRPPRQRTGLLPGGGGLRADRAWFTPDGEVVYPWDPRHGQPPPDASQDGWDDQLPGWRPRRRGDSDRPRTAEIAGSWVFRLPGGQPLERFDGRPGARGPSPRVSVRLPVWLHERVQDEARRLGTTPSWVVREVVGEHLGGARP